MLKFFKITRRKAAGFTLVELLIAVLITSVLSAIGFVTYGNTQIVSRDARRKNDLRALATALELYKQTKGRYPCPTTLNSGFVLSTNTISNWILDINRIPPYYWCDANPTTGGPLKAPDHINQMPIDPKTNGGNPITGGKGYAYGFNTSVVAGGSCPQYLQGYYFVLVTTLENGSDPDADLQKRYKYCDGTYIFGDPSTNTNGFAITSP